MREFSPEQKEEIISSGAQVIYFFLKSPISAMSNYFCELNSKKDSSSRSILVTDIISNEIVHLGYELGFDDILLSDIDPEHFSDLYRLYSGTRRDQVSETFQIDSSNEVIKLDPLRSTVTINGKTLFLTQTEFKIFAHVYKDQSQIALRSDLQLKILGYQNKTNRCLDVHIHNLRKKLQTTGYTLHSLRSIGVCLKPDGELLNTHPEQLQTVQTDKSDSTV